LISNQLLGEQSQLRKKVDMEEVNGLLQDKTQDGAMRTLSKMNVRMQVLGEEVEMLGVETRIPICNLQMTMEEEEAEAEEVVAVEAATNVVKTVTSLVNAQANKTVIQSQSLEAEEEVVVASEVTEVQ
jgi:hypothetical protein